MMTFFGRLCQTGHSGNIQKYIRQNKNINWNDGLHGACFGGHLSVAQRMIKKGANDWNDGLFWACYGGYLSIIEVMTLKDTDDWNWGVFNCCSSHPQIVKLMIQNGATNVHTCYPKEHIKIIQLLELGVTQVQLSTIHGIQTLFTHIAQRQSKIKRVHILLADVLRVISFYSLV